MEPLSRSVIGANGDLCGVLCAPINRRVSEPVQCKIKSRNRNNHQNTSGIFKEIPEIIAAYWTIHFFEGAFLLYSASSVSDISARGRDFGLD